MIYVNGGALKTFAHLIALSSCFLVVDTQVFSSGPGRMEYGWARRPLSCTLIINIMFYLARFMAQPTGIGYVNGLGASEER
ncbi:hypothetical protein RRG08_011027 [Elysia crispata]|uniref:Uncharacterized protein n=1 Tax=Elysia crispata TaxID=231223 RepID=A0AAE0YD41_9GAST|nr:hypothetical protein RRG08_011027 [Elysia crispata]